MSDSHPIDVVFSFDTTGSMAPAISQVRREVEKVVKALFVEVPDLRVGLIAHGDYCDKRSTYVTKILPITANQAEIIRFVQGVGTTHGGDSEECYELVLRQARMLPWRPDAKKVLAMIGDEIPHSPEEAFRQGGARIDWREELRGLSASGVKVYGVLALARRHADHFYEALAAATGGFRISLNQFFQVVDTIRGIIYKQVGDTAVEAHQKEVEEAGRMDRNLFQLFQVLLGRAPTPSTPTAPSKKKTWGTTAHGDLGGAADLRAVNPARFQVLAVDEACAIRDFVQAHGLLFKKGRGFYEFTKTETIQGYKEVVLRDKITGDMFGGEEARALIGLSEGVSARLKPAALDKYRIFVQSTSVNRKLVAGTGFLYEVEDWDRAS